MIIFVPPPGLTAADFWCDEHQCEKSSYWPELPTCPACEGRRMAREILAELFPTTTTKGG